MVCVGLCPRLWSPRDTNRHLFALSKFGSLAGNEQPDNQAEQTQDGAENLNDQNAHESTNVSKASHKLG